jgi:polyhydroxyalkanoate synthesis regulator phasin
MEKVTIKAYAVKHKLSIFNVMKMVKSGKLESDIVEEDGKEKIYIILNEATEKEIKEQIVPIERKEEMMFKEEVKLLRKEVQLLRKEIEDLKQKMQ